MHSFDSSNIYLETESYTDGLCTSPRKCVPVTEISVKTLPCDWQ